MIDRTPGDQTRYPRYEHDREDILADQGSYDEARRRLGKDSTRLRKTWAEIEADKAGAPATSLDRSRRAKVATGPQYGEEAGVGYPDGVSPENQPYEPLSPEQAARNTKYVKNWREIGAQAIRDGTHAVEDDASSR